MSMTCAPRDALNLGLSNHLRVIACNLHGNRRVLAVVIHTVHGLRDLLELERWRRHLAVRGTFVPISART